MFRIGKYKTLIEKIQFPSIFFIARSILETKWQEIQFFYIQKHFINSNF